MRKTIAVLVLLVIVAFLAAACATMKPIEITLTQANEIFQDLGLKPLSFPGDGWNANKGTNLNRNPYVAMWIRRGSWEEKTGRFLYGEQVRIFVFIKGQPEPPITKIINERILDVYEKSPSHKGRKVERGFLREDSIEITEKKSAKIYQQQTKVGEKVCEFIIFPLETQQGGKILLEVRREANEPSSPDVMPLFLEVIRQLIG